MMADIIIVGGGITGKVLALMLAQHTSLNIAICEASDSEVSWSQSIYHYRVSAITLSSKRILAALDVWNDLVQKRVSFFNQIHVWDANNNKIQFDSRNIAEPVLGYIIENNALQVVLDERIKNYAQIKIISPIQLVAYQEEGKQSTLTDRMGRTFSAKIIVAADGANSWLRSQVNINTAKHDYNQIAIVATVATALTHENTARQVFLKTGPLAFLPLKDTYKTSIVWSLPIDLANEYMQIPLDQFKQVLQEAFGTQLGDLLQIEDRHAFPLFKHEAKNYVKSKVVLVGDAAHVVHPLAGQGLNMGLLDAASLTEIINDAINKNRDFSSTVTLRRYERWRKADNFAMQRGVDALKIIFANETSAVSNLRSIGLKTINNAAWLKNKFIRYAVGNREGLPKLARLGVDHRR